MILKHYQLNQTTLKSFNTMLFYGKNEGLKNELISKYYTNNFQGLISKYEENEFIINFDLIFSEILSGSLFENEKIIIISRTSDKILKRLEEIIEKKPTGVNIILKSGILEKKSKLRTFFEKNKSLLVVPVYEDSFKDLSSIINIFLNKNKIKLSSESINLLISRSSGERENLKIELNKILNYSMSNKKVDIEVIEKLTNLAENISVNELADQYLTKNQKYVSKILNENIYSNDDCLLILRTILNKSKRLLKIIQSYKKNKNLDEIILNARPPIFWKEKEIVKTQANIWDLADLKERIYQINNIEILIKKNSSNSLNLVSDFVINCQ